MVKKMKKPSKIKKPNTQRNINKLKRKIILLDEHIKLKLNYISLILVLVLFLY